MQSINLHLNDFLRLGDLIEHANYHADEFGDDWWSFFQKHYGEDSRNHIQNQHKEEHQKLPKHDHVCSGSLAVFVLTNKLNISLKAGYSPSSKTVFFYQNHYSSIEAVDIFQPPKQA
ncbi:MAG: hypothetical protein WD530_05450 [Vicingaceae bacterium]